ncbi:UDP-beta-L-Ara: arabinan alpha-1,5-L-arabinosyltransferase, family GT47 [Zostera marina]|uniref:UDP-beta-L-Ara: arabinan alpha-1,5-L-arabinosyltransferase, family GT47 n=1 Tax=Zostera marina TaxID=29655 RepID=A0A0K9NRC2_ZOSMR|nr:UDP-beta-L-Ara: arabinan alpha-1,5-L-arabinosyltransferase, family GT47 [Zostera marina]
MARIFAAGGGSSINKSFLLKPRNMILALIPFLFLALLFQLFHFLFTTTDIVTAELSTSIPKSPYKIYLYDLPHRFTQGVVENYHLARNAEATPISSSYPGHQHSAEWYLFSDLLRSDRDGSYLSTVSDPKKAELFFVPFFSSLSLVVNPIGKEVGEYIDENMQEDLMDWLEGSEYWRRNGGRDHVFVCQDPNAMFKMLDKIKNSVLLISDFGRLKGNQASIVKDVVIPYSHRINRFKGDIGVETRGSLLFFMGNRFRKEGGKIRDSLFKILEEQKDVVIKHGTQSRVSRRLATQGMHSSKFCLHPAGDTPSACRLFDAIISLCIPVIISDYIELPFEDAIDYEKIAIFVDTETALVPGYLTNMLRKISTDRILQYQTQLQAVRHYFDYGHGNGAVHEIWRQISLKVPLIKLMINRDRRLVVRKSEGLDCSCLCSLQNGTTLFS